MAYVLTIEKISTTKTLEIKISFCSLLFIIDLQLMLDPIISL